MRTAKITIFFALVVVFCMSLVGFASAQGALTESAQMRIGYFALHPKAFDTYIDGELASFVPGLAQLSDVVLEPSWQGGGNRQYATTPFMTLPTGSHSIAFAPAGEGLDAAVLGPEAVTLEEGHVYSLAIIGKLEDETLNLLVIDETGATSLNSPAAEIFVHNIVGAPPLNISVNGDEVITGLAYGQYAIYHWTSNQGGQLQITDANDPHTVYLWEPRDDTDTFDGASNLTGLTGSYPGQKGEDYYLIRGSNASGDITLLDGGIVDIGDVVSGELPEIRYRERYTLSLDTASTLDIYVRRRGPVFIDTRVSIYDAQDHLLLWNNDTRYSYDAGIENYELAAGTYIIEVGASADSYAGQYELQVKMAESD